MSWFADKLGPLPSNLPNENNIGLTPGQMLAKSGVTATVDKARIEPPRGAKSSASPQPASNAAAEPEKKKKGWF